jgi:DNA topoisomerase-1
VAASTKRLPLVSPLPEPAEAAEAIDGLRYVAADEPGFRRVRWGRGFTYRDAKGRTVADRTSRRRFAALAIPPAWTDVWICRDETGHVQATGRDTRGRKQYRYHPRFLEWRSRSKFDALLPFSRVLPRIRRRVAADLRRDRLDRRKVLAIVVRLLDTTSVRIGNPEYARTNRSFGLTTLRARHVIRNGDATLGLRFPGKGGKEVNIEVTSRRLVRLVRRCQELPGQALFGYLDDDGATCRVDSDDVNVYLREIGGAGVSTKMFRTWSATVLAADELAALEPAGSASARKRQVTATLRKVARRLNNTLAVSRAHYVHPLVVDAFHDDALGRVFARHAHHDGGLRAAENAVVALLRRPRSAG